MSDPRFNSIHLGSEPCRRERYREAREAMLDVRGLMTLAGSALDGWGLGILDPRRWVSAPPAGCWLEDLKTGRVYPLRVGMNAAGRFANNDIVHGECKSVSRRHCVFVLHTNHRCEVHDTASCNGTFVNGQRIDRPVWLASGDLIQLAKWPIRYLTADDPEAVEDVQDTVSTIMI